MARLSKGILKAKKHVAPNGVVDVTPQRLKHWDDQQRLMLSRNLAPSVHFDHSDKPEDNVPVKLEADGKIKRGAHNAVGRLAQFQTAGDHANITLDLPDDLAADKSRKNIVGVSPVIVPMFRDGDGNEYKDCIVAYDLVTHPVDNTQTPFVEMTDAIACSLRVFDDANKATIYKLSADDDEKDKNPFAKKDGDGDGESGEGGGSGESASEGNKPPASDKPPELPPNAETPENKDLPADESSKFEAEAIVAHLSQLGVELPADWSFKSDAAGQILLASLKTRSKALQTEKAEEETEPADDPNSGETVVSDPGYAAMSLYAENMHRDTIKTKLNELLKNGQCTPAEAKQLTESITTIKLSLDASGKQLSKSDVETFILHRESVPKGTFWDDKARTRMSASVVEPPANMRGDLTTEETQNTVNWALGRKPATAAAK
jgi:hypothetical protein